MNDVVVFSDDGIELEVNVTPEQDTVWLTLDQISVLFARDKSVVSRHIRNIYKEDELDSAATVANFATVQKEGSRKVKRDIAYYNLDVIISVGYRVKSQRGIAFRRWATKILKQYLIDGVAVNEKRLKVLQRTVQIESRMLAGVIGVEEAAVLKVVEEYARSLELLDAYDHQRVAVPDGRTCSYQLQYDECMALIRNMEFSKESAIFGTEKEAGKLEGILAAIYQSAFGQEAYPTLEEKAANLLYFLVKDHPFNDGCKRIAAALFLYFLDKNEILYRENGKLISDSALVAITLMVAESRAEEKDVIVQVIMNFLHW